MFIRVIKDVNNKREMKKIYSLKEATSVLKNLYKAGYQIQITAISEEVISDVAVSKDKE